MEIAQIVKLDQDQQKFAYVATIQKSYHHSVDAFFQMIVDNSKLRLWFPELSISELKVGGVMQFDMGDGTEERMTILDYQHNEKLAFTWDQDQVTFYVEATSATTCQLRWTEHIAVWTEHTPRDIAGWHTCLEVIALLLAGDQDQEELASWRKERWQYWYDQYVALSFSGEK